MMSAKRAILVVALWTIIAIHQSTCQREQEVAKDLHLQMFYRWQENTNPQVELTKEEASWWYSLGEYRPRQNEYDEYYPRVSYPTYEYPPYPPYGGGGGPGEPRKCELIPGPMRTRYEFREMDATLRGQFTAAVMALANYCPSGCTPCNSLSCTSAYDIFVLLHQAGTAPSAHGGASFLPWHREFLWRFENALIVIGNYPSNMGLPYWDSGLDSGLPDATDAVMWTTYFMGTNSGTVGAPFAGLSVPSICSGTVQRYAGSGGNAFLFDEDDVTNLMSQDCFAHLLDPHWTCPGGFPCNFEDRHGYPHMWVGGDMGSYCSPSDPIFWLHHSHIDCLWEDHRQTAQITDLEKEYPQTSFGGAQAAWNAPMQPFPGMINAHGLSTHYTTYYYSCAARPSGLACTEDSDCNRLPNTNPALWCDTTTGTCRSKIHRGGNCASLPNNACWCPSLFQTPVCQSGICQCYLTAVEEPIGTLPLEPRF